MMNDDEKPIKFQSKGEIADCIRALTPFTPPHTLSVNGNTENLNYDFALQKIKELTKLL